MPLFTTLLGGKLVVGAFAVGSIALGGTAAVAATGSLPTTLQEQAHTAFGAPAPLHEEDGVVAPGAAETTDRAETEAPADTETIDPADAEATEPGGTETPDPDATSDPSAPAAPVVAPDAPAVPASPHGLCTAWAHGGLPVHSTAHVRLVAASGGADLATWCAPHLGTVARAEDAPAVAGSLDDRHAGSTSGRHRAHPGVTRSHAVAASDDQGDEDGQDGHDAHDSSSKDHEHAQDSGGSEAGGSDHGDSGGSGSD